MRLFLAYAWFVFGMAIPLASTAACIQPDSVNTWKWGLGGGSAWLQYGNHQTGKMYFTLLRSPVRESTRLILHDASTAISRTQEVPGFIDFSFESEFRRGGKNRIVAIEGVGILQEFQTGGVGLFVGNLDYPDVGLAALLKVSRTIKGSFRFYVGESCHAIPLPDMPHRVMNTLFSPQRIFRKEATKLFLPRP
ncbi:hypothetical protein [Ottowia thiooxydans]|uniref:hypothetical protein n=1 Tax=Ottowia thiooxydans TaxID=219182 RepID=UPI000421F065|nr:hypothetical protein [Ottowia thiooxydans]